MARDNYYCFMCGCYDTDWFVRQQPKPDGADFEYCNVVSIIKREALAQDEDIPEGGVHEVCQSFLGRPSPFMF